MQVELKKATTKNLRDVFKWRNEPNTIPWMASRKPVVFEDHLIWYNKVINDENCLFLIIYVGDEAVGQIRYNLEESSEKRIARVSMNITESMQGKGIGTRAFELGYNFVKELNFAQMIQVRVHEKKAGWIKKMELQGFKKVGTTNIHGQKQIVLVG